MGGLLNYALHIIVHRFAIRPVEEIDVRNSKVMEVLREPLLRFSWKCEMELYPADACVAFSQPPYPPSTLQ